MNRQQRFFSAWYRDHHSMRREEWVYIAQLITACTLGWGLGVVIGGVWILSM